MICTYARNHKSLLWWQKWLRQTGPDLDLVLRELYLLLYITHVPGNLRD